MEAVSARTLKVRTPDGSYPIHIGSGILAQLPDILSAASLAGSSALVTNETLAPLYGQRLAERLGARLVVLPDGEQYKTLDSIRALYDQFAAAELDRRSVVIALGGGVIGDMAGFAAATYLRGMPFVQVPTSLLAMVDSSVGGKTGVNLPYGKNLVGSFKQPELVLIDTDVLQTLPEAERLCGLAEAIKHGFLADPLLLDPSQYAAPSPDFVARAVQVKIDVVEKDPFEQNIRAYLNLGHTFGHALETVSGYHWRHGEGVGLGLVAAARLSYQHGLCDASLPEQVERIVSEAGLRTRFRDYDPTDIRAAMNSDKKRKDKRVRFVLLRGIGQPILCDDVPDEKVIAVLRSLKLD